MTVSQVWKAASYFLIRYYHERYFIRPATFFSALAPIAVKPRFLRADTNSDHFRKIEIFRPKFRILFNYAFYFDPKMSE